jgi:hypothetical protein
MSVISIKHTTKVSGAMLPETRGVREQVRGAQRHEHQMLSRSHDGRGPGRDAAKM